MLSLTLRLNGELIVCAHRIGSIYRRGSTSHVDGERDGFEKLLLRRAMLVRHFRVVSDAAIAVDDNADRNRHKLFCLCVDGV